MENLEESKKYFKCEFHGCLEEFDDPHFLALHNFIHIEDEPFSISNYRRNFYFKNGTEKEFVQSTKSLHSTIQEEIPDCTLSLESEKFKFGSNLYSEDTCDTCSTNIYQRDVDSDLFMHSGVSNVSQPIVSNANVSFCPINASDKTFQIQYEPNANKLLFPIKTRSSSNPKILITELELNDADIGLIHKHLAPSSQRMHSDATDNDASFDLIIDDTSASNSLSSQIVRSYYQPITEELTPTKRKTSLDTTLEKEPNELISNEERFPDSCRKTFGPKRQLSLNRIVHESEGKNICGECPESHIYEGNFQKHQPFLEDSCKLFLCNTCSCTFTRLNTLRLHYLTHERKAKYSCNVCKGTFTTRKLLKQHQRSHVARKLYTCNACSSTFTHKYSFRLHILTHKNKKPYPCKVFYTGSSCEIVLPCYFT